MKVIKKKQQRGSIILRIAVFAFAAFVAGSLLTQQVQIAEKRRQLEDLQQEIRLQEIKNEKYDLQPRIEAVDKGVDGIELPEGDVFHALPPFECERA